MSNITFANTLILVTISGNKKTNPFHFRKSWSVYLVLHQRGQTINESFCPFPLVTTSQIGAI